MILYISIHRMRCVMLLWITSMGQMFLALTISQDCEILRIFWTKRGRDLLFHMQIVKK